MIPNNILKYLHRVEGGRVNNPNDPGGDTVMGRTKRTALDWGLAGAGDVTADIAAKIYNDWYWVPSKASLLPWPMNLAHFDAAVNVGRRNHDFRRSGRFLQRAYNRVTDERSLVEDGVIGPNTRRAINDIGDMIFAGRHRLFEEYLWVRADYYLARRNSSLREFIPTWWWRLSKLREMAYAPED